MFAIFVLLWLGAALAAAVWMTKRWGVAGALLAALTGALLCAGAVAALAAGFALSGERHTMLGMAAFLAFFAALPWLFFGLMAAALHAMAWRPPPAAPPPPRR